MKNIVLTLLLIASLTGFAQHGGHSGGGSHSGGFEGEVFGTVTDSVSQEPLEYVIIKLFKPDSTQVGAMVTATNGTFSLKVGEPGEYMLNVSFIGYDTQVFNEIVLSKSSPVKNMNEIELVPSMLDVVTVKGDKPPVTYEIDKKVINVEDQNTNVGQTATEVLANAPSVTVDSDGNVSLRGSGSFTLLINGVPTAMDANNALQSIPASSIANIEIITNPSAKYDAEGASGIINIITKKKKLEGVSMNANLNYGNFENYGGDLAVSLGKEKFTFNLSGNYNSRQRPRSIEKSRTTYIGNDTSLILSNGEGAWKHGGWGVNGEIQWEPNSSHTLVVASNLTRRDMRPWHYLDFEEFENGTLLQSYENRQDNIIDIQGLTSSLYYQYKINRDPNHHLTFKAISSLRYVDQLDSAMYYDEEGNFFGGTKYVEIGPSNFNRFNVDYKRPFKNGSFEMGSQVQLGYSQDDGQSYRYDSIAQAFEYIDTSSSIVDYTRDVYAGYMMFRGKKEKFGYQVGVRYEYTHRTVEAQNPTISNANAMIWRHDWFPSAHFSYQYSDQSQFLASYSRRIERPRSWYFEPFITWETEFNVRSGNIELLPEYINNFELSWIRQFKEEGYFSIESYYRATQGEIDRVSTAYTDNVLITRPYNIGQADAVGIELTLQKPFKKWWEFNTGINLFYFNVTGELYDVAYDRTSYNANIRATNTFKFAKTWNFQLVTRYESPSATAQGERKSSFILDASIRKTFGDRKYSLNLQGRNLLLTDRRHETIITPELYLIRNNTPQGPMVNLTFTVNLNNYKKVLSRHEATDDF